MNTGGRKLILASASPRRQQLLKEMGFEFEVQVKDVDESFPNNLQREEIALYISEKKSMAFNLKDPKQVLICSDTIVWNNNTALGKPKDRTEAIEMIAQLSGTWHEVISAYTIKTSEFVYSDYDVSRVFFSKLDKSEIEYYVDTYKPFDKAGAYGIQEWIGLIGIEKIEGSYFNVMGLPSTKLYRSLKELFEQKE